MRCSSLRLRARLPILRQALRFVDARPSAMNPLRVAVVAAFVGASLWALAPLLLVGIGFHAEDLAWPLIQAHGVAGGQSDLAYVFRAQAAIPQLVLRAVQTEIAVVTLAAVAWVLAGMVKSKV